MKLLPAALLLLSLTAAAAEQIENILPKDARIIETVNVRTRNGKSRALVLWMNAPKRVMAAWDAGPDFVYGDHWFGPTSLSLVDPSHGKLLNTIQIHSNSPEDQDNFRIPFFTFDGPYYVPHPNRDHKGKPVLLHLQDLTGEGVAGQFALFDYDATSIYETSVWGYSPASDAAAHYSVELIEGNFKPVVQPWVTQVFAMQPVRPGYWKFTWEPGHGASAWVDEEVHFDRGRQLFVEKKIIRPYPGYAQAYCDVDASSLPDFLGRLARFGVETDPSLQSLIEKSPAGPIESAGIGTNFRGELETLQLQWQISEAGKIRIGFTTESEFAVALLMQLQPWCRAN